MITPHIFCIFILSLKTRIPTSTTQIGVSELRMPARELSILTRAIAKQNAGKRFPKKPVKTSRPAVFAAYTLANEKWQKG